MHVAEICLPGPEITTNNIIRMDMLRGILYEVLLR